MQHPTHGRHPHRPALAAGFALTTALAGQTPSDQDAPPPTVAFVVTDAAGAPLASQSIDWTLYGGILWSTTAAQTDAEGRLALALERWPTPGDRLLVRRRGPPPEGVRAWLRARGEPRGGAFVPLPRDLGPGRNELPAVQIAAEPIAAEGRVVDDAGSPLAGLRVFARAGYQMNAFRGHEYELWTTTDAEGRFTLRDLAAAATTDVEVRAEARGLAPLFATVELGGAPLRLVLRRAGELTIVLPGLPADAPDLLEATLVDLDAATDTPPLQLGLSGERLVRPAVGRYELRYGIDRSAPVATLDLVQVPPADRHARLVVPWQDHFRAITVTVRLPGGSPAVGRTVFQHVLTGERSYGGSGTGTDGDGRALLLVPMAGGVLSVTGDDDLWSPPLEGQRADSTVRLRALRDVEIALRGDWSVPEGVTLRFALQTEAAAPADDGRPWRQPSLFGVERRGEALHGRVREPGSYVLRVTAQARLDARTFRSRTIAALPIEVPEREGSDQADPERPAVELDAAAREALRAFRK